MDIFTMLQLEKTMRLGLTAMLSNERRQYFLLVFGISSVSPSDTQPIYNQRQARVYKTLHAFTLQVGPRVAYYDHITTRQRVYFAGRPTCSLYDHITTISECRF